MKKFLFLPALLAVLALPLFAEPALHLDTASLRPDTTFKLSFHRDVVTRDQVGKTVPNAMMKIEPPLAGDLKWIEPNVALFQRKGIPTLSTKYTFSLLPGFTFLDGTPIPAVKLQSLGTTSFSYQTGYWHGNTRNPSYFLRFNDAIDPGKVAGKVYFVDKKGSQVAARLRQGIYSDLRTSRALGPTWSQSFEGWSPPDVTGLDPQTRITTAITATPVHPLPVGENWKLVVERGIRNLDGSSATTKPIERWIGSVTKFEVASIQAVTRIDTKPYLSIGLSKKLPENFNTADLAQFIEIDPLPANMELEASRTLISIKGDFPSRSKWKVTVKRGMIAFDGLAMLESKSAEVRFRHHAPVLAAPSYAAAQLAIGSRTYAVQTVNVAKARIRAKRLTGRDAVRALQGYRHYSGDGPNSDRITERHTIPWSLVSGEPVYDQTIELDNAHDTSAPIEITWDEVLGRDKANGLLFLHIEADPKPGMESYYARKKVTQVLMQLTDIGLAWKINKESAFLYAYSCHTGKPLPNVQLDVFGEDARAMQSARTNEAGVARLPRSADQRHLRASLGEDSVMVDFDRSIPTVSMWRFPVNTEWEPELPNRRTALLFTDRTLYRPGEEVHLKGIVRRIENNRSVFDSSGGAQLVIRDSSSRILQERDLTLSKRGSFDHSFTLPGQTVGFFSFELSWPEELAAAEEMDGWHTRRAHRNSARFIHNISVQEFRRNAFESKAAFVESGSADQLKLELRANYFQGQPVAGASVDWFYRSRAAGFYPASFRDYLFCDHRTYDAYYWSHYFGYGTESYRRSLGTSNGTATLDTDGFTAINFDLEEIPFPAPRNVTVTSEVLDQRNQTLSTDAGITVHSSDFYIGISRLDKLVRVGDEVSLKAVAVQSDGTTVTGDPIEISVRIEREVHEQVKTRTESGTVAVRNERRLETVTEALPFTLDPADAEGGGTPFPFKPGHSGKYILTFSGSDPQGRPIRTAITQRVYGSEEYPWAYENGMLIKLVPEKKRYRPGETARILVQTPIEGTALVTMERDGVHRHLIRELTADNPVVEIPLAEDDAPNTFVSVLVIKGSKDNLRKHKEPILRLGYCELAVEVVRERLQVALKIPGDYHRPGEEVTIDGHVRDHEGNAVSGAEVTLYAEDEGTLAVAGYANPDPVGHFYSPRSLRTEAGTSLGKILSEDPGQRHTFNKGFFIGGGAPLLADGLDGPEPRTDFNPCAIWLPALQTDEEGRFQAQFESPDTLTRYRVIAVAHHGSGHFGREISEFTVSKPLMLEPSTPRFAHEGDRLQPKVLVQNATSHTGTWDVTLKLGSLTHFAEHPEKTETKSITIPADSSATLSFDLAFRETGETDWQWIASPRSLDGVALDDQLREELSDAVTTSFAVEYPMPLLRETRFIKFQNPSAKHDMLEGLSEELLEGRGQLELEFGRSVLLEAGGALDFLLRYPYGCLEQTTSSTIPWIAALHLRGMAPTFRSKTEKDIRRNIQAGANRLISMQCDDGGLAYWAGGDESEPWASAYGGMALLLCREAGAHVSESVLEELRGYLTEQLRGIATSKDWWAIETACRSCFTLALAGDPQVAYHNKLLENPGRLTPNALNFLSLAVAKSGVEGATGQARKILTLKGAAKQRGGHFMSYHPSAAYRLLALVNIDPGSSECDKAIDRIIKSRGRRSGHWGTTWGNAWTVFALGEYARLVETSEAPPVMTLVTDEGRREFTLDDESPSNHMRIPLHGGLKAEATSSKGGFARVHLSSKPRLAPQKAVSQNGLQILRTYHRVLPDGSEERLDHPEVGDLVRIQLQVTMPRDDTSYLVIDDPMPSIFEAVNTDFASQAGRLERKEDWRVSHQELRDDRALFFVDHLPRSGSYTLSYHARVTSAGSSVAPPAKVEAMYEPDFYALSASRRFTTPNPLHAAAR